MNLRHAAALALLGWYLMMPSWTGDIDKHPVVEVNLPISQWQIEGSYDSAKACADAKTEFWEQSKHFVPEQRAARNYTTSVALCIATDDPRLKEAK